ncbi:MAG: SUMF1/EgtB/PvdO family nonheme iron enzyme [Symbiopectobacterium sp.]
MTARGGAPGLANETYGFYYADSNNARDRCPFHLSGCYHVRYSPVALKRPNALGLYDMSGNMSQ